MSERSKVYVIQEIAGTKEGKPKINILGADWRSCNNRCSVFYCFRYNKRKVPSIKVGQTRKKILSNRN